MNPLCVGVPPSRRKVNPWVGLLSKYAPKYKKADTRLGICFFAFL